MNMKINSLDKGFYSCLRSIIFVNKLFGVVTFNVSKRQFSRFHQIINLMWIIIYIAMSIQCLIKVSATRETLDLLNVTDFLQIFSTTLQLVVTWLLGAVNQKQHLKFLNKFENTEKSFNLLGVWFHYSPLHKTILTKLLKHLSLLFVVLFLQIYLYKAVFEPNMFAYGIVLYLPYIINSSLIQLVITYLQILKSRFKILNDHLALLGTSHEESSKNLNIISNVSNLGNKLFTLRVIGYLHHELTKCCKYLNKIFGIILLAQFAVSFIATTVCMYFISTASKASFVNLLAPLTICGPYSLGSWYICHCCQITKEEVKSTDLFI